MSIVFLDLETTGLEPDYAVILELGMIVTDDDLTEIDRESWVIGFTPDRWDALDPVVLAMHGANGLLEECQESGLHRSAVQCQALDWLEAAGVEKGAMMAGNTIGFDRKFLAAYMPTLLRHFHYRSIDISSLNECARRWNPTFYATRPQAEGTAAHRALGDLDVSIALAKHYRGLFV